jgi:hypothetical protein
MIGMYKRAKKAVTKKRLGSMVERQLTCSPCSNESDIRSQAISCSGKRKKDRASLSRVTVDFLEEPPQFSLVAKRGFTHGPFKAAFIDARTKDEAERIFRRALNGKEAQIDQIYVNKFCALVIYHDPKIPTG